jgi:hypothetical protein
VAKLPGDHTWRPCFEELLDVSDLAQTKVIDGRPTRFLRFCGPDRYVVSFDGEDRIIARDEWNRLPTHFGDVSNTETTLTIDLTAPTRYVKTEFLRGVADDLLASRRERV